MNPFLVFSSGGTADDRPPHLERASTLAWPQALPSFLALAAGPHHLHPNAAAALGTPARRELTPTLTLGSACPRARVAAGAPLLPEPLQSVDYPPRGE